MPKHEDPCSDCRSCRCGGEGPTRREMLRESAAIALGALLVLGGNAAALSALPVRSAAARTIAGAERSYPIPEHDGVSIDDAESLMIVRWRRSVHVFSLACPHRGAPIRWEADRARFRCARHGSTYTPDGIFIQGRATRGLDRFPLRRDGGSIVVNVDRIYQQDTDPEAWARAELVLD